MTSVRRLAVFNATSFVIHLLVSILTQFKVINNQEVGEVSDKFPSVFTPAGFTFSIWSVIYTGLLAFCIYHLSHAFRRDDKDPANRDLQLMGTLFIVNNIATAAWLLVWVNELLALSTVFIIIQLITLIIIHARLKIHDAHRSFQSKLFTQFPLSIYLAWISIATIANISTWLSAQGWDGAGMSEINWTITMMAIAMLITVAVINRKKNVFFGLVVIWAFYGITQARRAEDPQTYEPIVMFGYIAMAIVGAACLFGLVRNLRRR